MTVTYLHSYSALCLQISLLSAHLGSESNFSEESVAASW